MGLHNPMFLNRKFNTYAATNLPISPQRTYRPQRSEPTTPERNEPELFTIQCFYPQSGTNSAINLPLPGSSHNEFAEDWAMRDEVRS